MRVGLAIPLLLLAALVAASPTPAAERADARVRLSDCSLSTRSATFVARMRQVPGADRMWLRVRLLEKGTAGYRSLRAPGLGRWRRSNPGVGAFTYRQGVRGLQPGALYRAEVDFRWYDASGNLVDSARRRSRACRQFDALPDLAAGLVGSQRGSRSGVVRYRVRVANEGVAPATAVPVQLSVDDHVVDTVTLAALLPGEERLLDVPGPECGASVEAMVDPDGVIVESDETDNAQELTCAQVPRS